MPDRLRRLIAGALKLLPGQCTISLREWEHRAGPRTNPWSPNQRGCRDNAERYGLCNIACQKIVGPLGGARGGAR